jgi:tetratricopeptide (TPR) repeat protein
MDELLNEKDQLIALEKLFNEEKYAEGLELSEQLLKEFPESFQIQFMTSKLLRATGKLSESEDILSELISTHDNHLNLFLEIGGLSLDLKKYSQALDYYNKALFIDPFNSQAKEAVKELQQKPGTESAEDPGIQVAMNKEKEKWKADTLPEEEINNILNDSLAEGGEEADLTEDSIQLEEEEIKPSIPGVDESYVETDQIKVETAPDRVSQDVEESLTADPVYVGSGPEKSGDEVSTEDVADLFVDSAAAQQKLDTVTTRVPKTEQGDEFITESAAELYLSQGLYEEALYIYEKLYQNHNDDKFLAKVNELKSKSICQKKIKALTVFLNIIQERGGEVV